MVVLAALIVVVIGEIVHHRDNQAVPAGSGWVRTPETWSSMFRELCPSNFAWRPRCEKTLSIFVRCLIDNIDSIVHSWLVSLAPFQVLGHRTTCILDPDILKRPFDHPLRWNRSGQRHVPWRRRQMNKLFSWYSPPKEAQKLVVRGDGKGGRVPEHRIAHAVHHRGEHVLEPQKLESSAG